jgi:hypothetical protein
MMFTLKSLPILDTLEKVNSLPVNVDIPTNTKRVFWISFYPSKIDLEISIYS